MEAVSSELTWLEIATTIPIILVIILLTYANVYDSGIISSSRAQFTCGQFVYDARRFLCCENTDLCKRDGTRACCGRFCYNPTIGMCCKGRIRDRCDSEDASCCADRCYSMKKQMCCNGKVVARCAGNESACCDTGCYNPRWKQCKNGKIIFPQKSRFYY
ncbi:hypothetical protein T4A_9145 [Trichinella pseudospiralis]|uniref:Galaxin-like repeats domain-containing protein n=1 Tax=Trichinella pseudospiralis TaxID=6337 RepID=A0A0V1ELS6_TRIPS|nr:hypothetical protein T4A_3485 [Trichinella pseudospiralis]KRY74568.1 hypothetical protein T4A_12874 [Trichinella pseudospiralis]KRY74607.1 hypothetical protein T4A_9145 [Trichinella pseudospiralis]KRZ37562.1 hypothetical protein T4C_13163 [Trichinella pseudospiralis]